ncbi:MAG TPA: hypothetical protein DCL77_01710 [Prolixibacteraceae bacterium]|jgi:hypothetical protein|nr:hypothetical protein [Prolixibacteraceae bacterium]
MEEYSLAISILALIAAGYTYIIHDRKIKSQEARINEYELSKIDNEKIEEKQAKVRLNRIKTQPGSQTIKIYNAGRAKARNIRIEFSPEDYNGFIRMDDFPYPYLNPQGSTEIIMHLVEGGVNTLEMKILWDDDYKLNNEYTEIIPV